MSEPLTEQDIVNRERLKMLEYFFYVAGGSKLIFVLVPLIYVMIGGMFIIMSSSPSIHTNDAPPAVIGWLFVLGGLAISFLMAVVSAAQIFAGRCIHNRRHRVFCMVAGGIGIMGIPWGAALGVFTFLLLLNKSVAQTFDAPSQEAQTTVT